MYKCDNCGNVDKFEEINIIKTYVTRKERYYEYIDKFQYRENVICSECGSTMDKGLVLEGERK